MEILALVLFAVAAAGGLFLALRHFQGATLPIPVAVLHGLFAAAGLVVLALVYFGARTGGNGMAAALLVLVVAALGGFFLVSFHLRGARAPSPAVVVHALVAVAGFLTLLFALLL